MSEGVFLNGSRPINNIVTQMKKKELTKTLLICFNLKSSKMSLALSASFELSLPMLWVHGSYNVFNSFSNLYTSEVYVR